MIQPKKIKGDICIFGAGAGGLTVASVAAQMGARVVLIEQDKMGGDCLNSGCVPSKSLLAAAKAAKQCAQAKQFGIHLQSIEINFSEVMDHIKKVIETIAEHDSVERFTNLGVQVIHGHASFVDEKTVVVNDTYIQARRFVIATGSTASIPPIPGLEKINFLTNETIFSLNEKPTHLIVIGGGPIGCEIAQAFAFLGCRVTLLEAMNILPKDDSELVLQLKNQLTQDGVIIHEKISIKNVKDEDGTIFVEFENNGNKQIISGSHLLVATGRRAKVDGLNLEAAKIQYTPKGIQVDQRLRTTNKSVFAMGDVIGGYQFTHVAGYHAGIIIKNCLFRIPAKADNHAIPWVTYTMPELAHVGLSTDENQTQDHSIKTLRFSFQDNDRAQAELATLGTIKVITAKNGKILGVSILGENAGELLLPWVIAIQNGRNISEIAKTIAPYPTLSEISKRVAGEFYVPMLFSKRIKKIVKILNYFG